MEMDTLTRFDYCRLMYRGPVEGLERWEKMVILAMPASATITPEVMKKSCRFFTIYDGKARTTTKAFEVWGQEAHWFIMNLPYVHYGNITRVDVRTSIPTPPKDIKELYFDVEAISTNARRTVGYMTSPSRTKAEGRDVGGRSLTVGVKESARRLSIYKRGKENWALEVQFSHGRPWEIIRDAKAQWEENMRDKDCFEYIKMALFQAYYDAIPDLTGHSYGQFAHLEMWTEQEGIFNNQESLLADLEERFDNLDPEARTAFVESVIYPAGYRFMPVKVPAPPEIVRIPVQYSDDELADMELQSRLDREQGHYNGVEYDW